MKMFIQRRLESLSEDFYNLMLMLILFAGILIVIKTMMLQGTGSFISLQNLYQGSN
jgi:hypothetical protein